MDTAPIKSFCFISASTNHFEGFRYAGHAVNLLVSLRKNGNGKLVRHERAWCYREGVRTCTRDGGGPPGAGLQEQASNHLQLRWLGARGVSVKDKSWLKTVAGEVQGGKQPRPTDEGSIH
jgi:hypothetical protein